jgi:hypothetical protein
MKGSFLLKAAQTGWRKFTGQHSSRIAAQLLMVNRDHREWRGAETCNDIQLATDASIGYPKPMAAL